MKKALIAMSGGVDSSAAAWLTRQMGYDCAGAMMRMFDSDILPGGTSSCCSLDDAEDARAVARKMGMPFHVINAKAEFAEHVISDFIDTYERGETPNPCINCNRHLKFDLFLRRAQILGYDKIVTGHYARIEYDEARRRWLLKKALDESKDQSYVLACLNQEQLSHTLLPLGTMTKAQSRAIAEEQGFINARKRDSQDICFVPDGDYVAFMEHYTGKHYEPGDFLDLNGQVVGRHRGAVCYTLGQRKGLGLAMGAPVYVCAKDMEKNTVTVGPNESLFATTLLARDFNWIALESLTEPTAVTARARYNQKEQPATVYPAENGLVKVVFREPQRAMTPGQSVVLYQGDMVLGGGTIDQVLS
ncbi:MAG: tRNA 2-thiouridine(34) synthase MnmA [Oscillospiraceae bacterium]|nr:tRNA 2-thiouridine(34) synthase MnmA [Oscillospiraceae bacterium]